MISSEKLEILINSTTNEDVERMANSLITALNDWPTIGLSEPDELIHILKNSIAGKLTYHNISKYMKSLNLKTDAWKLESLTSILEMFNDEDINNNLELEIIINRIIEE